MATMTVPIAEQAAAILFQARLLDRLVTQAQDATAAATAVGFDLKRRCWEISDALDADFQDVAASDLRATAEWADDIAGELDDKHFSDPGSFVKFVEVAVDGVRGA